MRNVYILFAVLLIFALAGCGGKEEFVISCDIEGLDTRGIEMVYMTRGGVMRQSFHPVDGKVDLRASSAQPTLVEVYTLDGTLLFSCVASDGDRMEMSMKLGDPSTLSIAGQDATRDFTAFVVEHDSILSHGDDAEVNSLIAESVRSNPNSMASTLLMVTHFRTVGHELEADSLLGAIAPEARPQLVVGMYAMPVGEQVSPGTRGEIGSFTMRNGRDTVVRFSPGMQSYTLLVFNNAAKPDSVGRRLRDLRKDLARRRLQMIEISLSGDSAQWRGMVNGDSATWLQAWVPGGPSAMQIRRMSVPRVPYYIVADSNGSQHYRGTSVYVADTLLRSLLSAHIARDSVETDAETDGMSNN